MKFSAQSQCRIGMKFSTVFMQFSAPCGSQQKSSMTHSCEQTTLSFRYKERATSSLRLSAVPFRYTAQAKFRRNERRKLGNTTRRFSRSSASSLTKSKGCARAESSGNRPRRRRQPKEINMSDIITERSELRRRPAIKSARGLTNHEMSIFENLRKR